MNPLSGKSYTWQGEVPREVEHFLGRGGQVRRRADLLDEAIANRSYWIPGS